MESENSSYLHKASEVYEHVWDQRDKRMDKYFVLSSPLVVIALCSFYIIFSLYLGPRWMKNRPPYNIKPLVVVFNVLMIVLNAYLHIQGWRNGWSNYKLVCEPVDTSDSPYALMISKLTYYYLLTKFFDWIDTLFFIMRKKFNHVSFLHVYHHTCMPLNTWPVARFLPGGHMTFPGLINTVIHVFMHTYYALAAALGPKYQKYLWWKKYITRLQIFQFVFGLVYLLPLLHPNCGIPKTFLLYMFPQGMLFLFLFLNFYKHSYQPNRKKSN
uniref:Elongation of very long chain fatty acids protein n=1 Tax=Strigamia maritima TaxID=126957 RepID=T1INI1_STRMM